MKIGFIGAGNMGKAIIGGIVSAGRDFLPGNVHAGNYLPLVPFRTDD